MTKVNRLIIRTPLYRDVIDVQIYLLETLRCDYTIEADGTCEGLQYREWKLERSLDTDVDFKKMNNRVIALVDPVFHGKVTYV
jgi:hypothetical protein